MYAQLFVFQLILYDGHRANNNNNDDMKNVKASRIENKQWKCVSIDKFILYRNIHNNQSKSNNLLLPLSIVCSSDDLQKVWVPLRLQMNENKKNVFL